MLADITSDADVAAAFENSNIEAGYRDNQRSVLTMALEKLTLGPSNVLGLSMAEVSLKPDGSSMGTRPMLLIVCKTGIVMAEEKGIFSKRVETQSASYGSLSAVPDEKMYDRGRGEIAIQFFKGGSVPLFRVGWDWSQPGRPSLGEAAEERDRILSITRRAMQGDWTPPSAALVPQSADATTSAGKTVLKRAASANEPHGSQRQRIIDWTVDVCRAAGVAPAPELVDSTARGVAVGLVTMRVLPFAERADMPALDRYVRGLPGELPDLLDQIDDICATWTRLATEKDSKTRDPSNAVYRNIRKEVTAAINQTIGKFLAASRDSYVEGIRDQHGR